MPPPPRIPTSSDTKNTSLTISITPNPESPSRPPTNVLILLHGLGDSEAPFHRLGQQLNLPGTCVVAVRGGQPLPFGLEGYHWGDDIKLDTSGGPGGSPLDPDAGFAGAMRMVREQLIESILIDACGFAPRNILLWGFGQGGMVALATVDAMDDGGGDGGATASKELAGVISIGGILPDAIRARTANDQKKARTPVLLLGGASQTAVTDDQVGRVKRVFDFVERTTWRRSGDGMPRDRTEMTPIMQFLARRLKAGAPDGTVEIG